MPFGDGTGPRGLGPMTGRGAGFCAGFGAPGFTNPMPGRWFGRGWRAPSYGSPGAMPYGGAAYPAAMPYGGYAGAGMGGVPGAYPYAPQMTREQELDFLRSQAQAIKGQLEQIDGRIKELEKEEG